MWCEALSAFSHACASHVHACMHVYTWTRKKYFMENPFTFSVWNADYALLFALNTNLKPDFAAVYIFTSKQCTPGFSTESWTPCNNLSHVFGILACISQWILNIIWHKCLWCFSSKMNNSYQRITRQIFVNLGRCAQTCGSPEHRWVRSTLRIFRVHAWRRALGRENVNFAKIISIFDLK